MNNPQNARRARTRSNKRSKRPGNGARIETKVRGNPKQLLEKYKTLARDALQAGDRIDAENYLQHADHYQRVLNERAGLSSGLFDDDEDEFVDEPRPSRRRRREAHESSESQQSEQPSADGFDEAEAGAGDGEDEEPAPKPKRRTRRPRARKDEGEDDQPKLSLSNEEAAA
ncbi:MAG: DUF4167 domain-containing protein [Rhodothalassiaceae bacterium]